MKIIHLNGFTEKEKKEYKLVVHQNVLQCITSLLEACKNLFNYRLSKANRKAAEAITDCNGLELTEELAEYINMLWNDKSIQKSFARSSEFQLLDSCEYYISNLERLAKKDYIPTEQDILRSRAKTTGVTELIFEIEHTKFRLVDVGGQRSERKKWIHCFQDVTAVIFCVAMSEYDLRLYEDERVRRVDEAIKLFDEICNSEWFISTSMILFLNKSDIFKEKIKRVSLQTYYPEYDGGPDMEKAAAFLQAKFVALNKNPTKKQIYPQITCATDTNNITFVFNACKTIILQKAVSYSLTGL